MIKNRLNIQLEKGINKKMEYKIIKINEKEYPKKLKKYMHRLKNYMYWEIQRYLMKIVLQ